MGKNTYTAPRIKSVPKYITLLKGELSEARPELAIFCMTAPNRNEVALPLRSFPKFEVIVPERGRFEVQRTVRTKRFKDPENDMARLQPVEEGTFDRLPRHIEEKYEAWRVQQKNYIRTPEYKRRFRELIRESEAVVTKDEEGKTIVTKPQCMGVAEFSRTARDLKIKADDFKLRELYRRFTEKTTSTLA